MENDGKAVEPTVSEGTVIPTVDTTVVPPQVDPVEAKVKELLAKERANIVEEARRVSQSQADKTTAALQRQLQEERTRRQALEGALNTMNLGPDTDPNVVNSVRLAQTQAQLGAYRQQELARQQAEQVETLKRQALDGMRQEIADLGLNPDDSRIEYDLNTPDADTFYKKAMRSAAKAIREDEKKTIPQLVKQAIADEEARKRKESGVDSHESAGVAAGTQVFTRAQIKDRKFYEANKEAIEKAAKEGRIK